MNVTHGAGMVFMEMHRSQTCLRILQCYIDAFQDISVIFTLVFQTMASVVRVDIIVRPLTNKDCAPMVQSVRIGALQTQFCVLSANTCQFGILLTHMRHFLA